MNLKKIHIFFLLLLISVYSLFSASVKEYEMGGLSIEMPEEWVVDFIGDSLLTNSPDDEVILALIDTEIDEPLAAYDQVINYLNEILSDFEIDFEDEEKLNNMDAYFVGGYAADGNMIIGFYIIETPSDNLILFIGFSSLYGAEEYGGIIEDISNSIKPQ